MPTGEGDAPRRVLMITSRSDHGGGPEHVARLVEHLPGSHLIWIASPDDHPYGQIFDDLVGLDRRQFIPARSFRLAALRELLLLVRRERIEVVHSHGKGAGTYGRLLRAACRGAVCVHTFHGIHTGSYGRVGRRLYSWYERLASRVTDRLIFVSSSERTQARSELGLRDDERSVVIPNGVTLPSTVGYPAGNGPLRVVLASRYNHQKNPALLVEIVDAVAQRRGPGVAHFTIYGDGELRRETEVEVGRRGLSHLVSFEDFSSEFRSAIRESDVLLSTSRWEGMPLAVLEAMSEGRPAVASNVPGHADAVQHAVNGLLFDLGSPEGAADLLLGLADDRPWLKALARKARATALADFGADLMAERTAHAYGPLERESHGC